MIAGPRPGGGDGIVDRMTSSRAQTAATILVPLCLWTVLLLSLPYSATVALILKLAVWGLPAILVPKLLEHVDPGGFLLLKKAPALELVVVSVVLLGVYYVLVTGGGPGLHTASAYYLASAVLLSPIVEEAAFRGLVLGKLGQVMSFGASNVVTALLFVIYHLPLWFARGDSIAIPACLWVAFFSLAMGWLARRSGSLWTCVIVHAAQNLMFGVL